MRKKIDLPNLILGSAFLALLLFMFLNQKSSVQTSRQEVSQRNEKQFASLQQQQCTVNSDDFIYSDCAGFYE